MRNTFLGALLWGALNALCAVSCLAEKEIPPPPDDLEQRNAALKEVEAQFAILEDADANQAVNALFHQDYRVRARAAKRLAELGQDAADAGPALVEALHDENRDVRLEAAAALGDVRDEKTIEPLIRSMVDKDPKVRVWAWKSLRDMKKHAIPVLISHLKSTSPLRKLGYKDEAKNKQLVRNEIIRLMPSLGEEPVAALAEALSDGDKWLKRSAATTLGQFGPKAKSAIPELLSILGSSNDGEQKIQIILALGKIEDHSPSVITALERVQQDKNKNVVKEARKSLKLLRDIAQKKDKEKSEKSRPERKQPERKQPEGKQLKDQPQPMKLMGQH